MQPLASLFGLGVQVRNSLYNRHIAPVRRLRGPVISVGNLSVGGSGKTPFVLLLGGLLLARGVKFDVLDRLLPVGRLREPLTSLRRADAIVLTSGASQDAFPIDGKLVWQARRGIMTSNVPNRPVVFCGIARPKNFVLQLRLTGIEPA